MFWKKKKKEEKSEVEKKGMQRRGGQAHVPFQLAPFEQPEGSAYGAMDSAIIKSQGLFGSYGAYGIDEEPARHFAERSFIGYTMIANIAKNWLVDKACSMPAGDAVRQGWEVQCGNAPLEGVIKKLDEERKISRTLEEYITMGRVYGGQLAIFDVSCANPDEFYENPFNLDSVKPGTYRGIILVDPPDARGILTHDAATDPTSPNYMKPVFWEIGGRRYHHTHVIHLVPFPVTRLARQRYNFFGVSVPERIYESVYAAEKMASETLGLAATKRITAFQTSMSGSQDLDLIEENLAYLQKYRDNFGVLMLDAGASVQQLDTSLVGLDDLVMTHYQLAAASACIPATKLLETTPKGFASTGAYEAESYRQGLESIQTNHLTPLLERHYELCAAHFGNAGEEINIQWQALDSPTAAEYQQIEIMKAQVAGMYHGMGVLDNYEIKEKLVSDEESTYFGLEKEIVEEEPEGLPDWTPSSSPSGGS